MQKLVCDVCGGNIQIQAGGKEGVCEYCGATYTMDRLREILNGVKVSQTGSAEDVEQWRELAKKYYAASSFGDAENVVKKILEASPRDEDANHMYEELQELKYFDVRNGNIVSYKGRAHSVTIPPVESKEVDLGVFSEGTKYHEGYNAYIEELIIPEGVERIVNGLKGNSRVRFPNLTTIILPTTLVEIGQSAFSGSGLESVSLPTTLTKIGQSAFSGTGLKSIIIPSSVNEIGVSAFSGCRKLTEVVLPNSLSEIESDMFNGCSSLQHVELPQSLIKLGYQAFRDCKSIKKIIIPQGVKSIGYSAFRGCEQLERLVIPDSVDSIEDKFWNATCYDFAPLCAGCNRLTDVVFPSKFDEHLLQGTPYIEILKHTRAERRANGYCPYCNVPLRGLFTKCCPNCQRRF